MFLTTTITATAIEYFMTGASCAISLYCGTKLPKNKRKRNEKNT